MSLWPTVVGIAFGLGVALVANLVFLPMTLKSQAKQGITQLPGPLGRLDLAAVTKAIYRFVMPILFSFVFAIGANQMFGAAP